MEHNFIVVWQMSKMTEPEEKMEEKNEIPDETWNSF